MDVSQFGKGAIETPLTIRDYRLELVAGTVQLPKKFSLKDKVGKVKNQGLSLSCVGQSFAYYAELLNFIESGEYIELSARDIYSLIYQEEGGAYSKDGASKICNSGVVLEKEAASYENGNPPTENFMRNRKDITNEAIDNGKTYMAKSYVTWDNQNIDMYKQAIIQGNGCVVISWGNNPCWANGDILLPDNKSQMSWRHQFLILGYDDEKQAFEIYNSWGIKWGFNGFGYLPYSYVENGYLTNPITLIDIPNNTYVKLVSQIVNLQLMIIKFLKDKINAFLK